MKMALGDLVKIKTTASQKREFALKLEDLKPYLDNYDLSKKEIDQILDDDYEIGVVNKDE